MLGVQAIALGVHGTAEIESLGRSHDAWLTMQVICEPVSAPNSLLTGKLTGNFAESGPSLRF